MPILLNDLPEIVKVKLISHSTQGFAKYVNMFFLQNVVPQIHVSRQRLYPRCVSLSAHLATNVDLLACFAERLFKSSFSYYMKGKQFGNYDSPQRRLSSRLEPSSHEFRLAVKLGVVSVYVFDFKKCTRNICVLTGKNTNQNTDGECILYLSRSIRFL